MSASRLTSEGYNVRDAVPSEPDEDGYDNTAFALRAGHRFGSGAQAEAHVLESDGFTEFDGGFVNEADLRQRVYGARLALRPAAFWEASLLAGRSIDEQENRFNGEARTRFDSMRDSLSLLNELSLSERYLWTFGLDLQRDRIESTTDFTRDARRNAGAFTQLAAALGGHDFLFSVRRDDNEQFGGATTGAGGFARLDLLGEYTLGPEWRLQLRVENVLDRDYETAASFNAPGRGVFVTLCYARDGRGARPTSSDAQRGDLP